MLDGDLGELQHGHDEGGLEDGAAEVGGGADYCEGLRVVVLARCSLFTTFSTVRFIDQHTWSGVNHQRLPVDAMVMLVRSVALDRYNEVGDVCETVSDEEEQGEYLAQQQLQQTSPIMVIKHIGSALRRIVPEASQTTTPRHVKRSLGAIRGRCGSLSITSAFT